MNELIKINGYEFQASQGGSGPSLFVAASECSRVARRIIKAMGLKASVKTSNGYSIDITLPIGTSDDVLEQVRQNTHFLAGANFDGMQDLLEVLDAKTDDGRCVYLMSKFVFVKRAWK